MIYAKRVDANHTTIADAFRACGWLVLDLARLGNGVPDLLVKKGDCWLLIEVKTARGKLRQKQHDFAAIWPVCIVRTLEDVQWLTTASAPVSTNAVTMLFEKSSTNRRARSVAVSGVE